MEDKRKNYFSLTAHMIKSGILSAMEYRVSFITQVVGMLVNDAALVGVWIIFFERFPSVNGWGLSEMFLLFGVGATAFSLSAIFAKGAFEMARAIARGEIDHFFAYPQNILWQITVSKTDIAGIGDLIFGVTMFILSGYTALHQIALFVLAALMGALIYIAFYIWTNSLAFFVGNFEEAAEQMYYALVGFTLFPQSVFGGVLKAIMLTILPAFFVGALPVDIIQHFSFQSLGILAGFTVLFFGGAVLFFRYGLKKYESGNLINVRL